MKILITGSRDWTDRRRIIARLMELPDDTTIIEGGAIGADLVAAHVARALNFHVITAKADWSKYGRAAGPLRNRAMLDMKPDLVIAFCKNQSRGTMDCVKAAIERGIPVELVDVQDSRGVSARGRDHG